MRGVLARVLPLLISIALLALVLDQVGARNVLTALSQVSPGWVILGLAISLPQFVLSALRWRWVSEALGTPLPFATALREYYLAVFLNNVLPGGVLGDGARIWRTGQGGRWSRAAQSVIVERLSGQAALLVIALLALAVLWHRDARLTPVLAGISLPLAAGAAALLLGVTIIRRRRYLPGLETAIGLLLSRRAFVHLGLSVLIVGSYIAVFACASLALGAPTPVGVLLVLVPWVLLAMLLPSALGGLGVREAAAGALWLGAGLESGEGVATAMLYGVLCLLASAPGLVVVMRSGVMPARRRPESGNPFPSASVEPVSAAAGRSHEG